MKLYEIAKEYEGALNALSEMDLTLEVVEDTLSAIKGEVVDKGRAVGAYILNLEADIGTLKEHESRIAARRKSLETRLNWLREYLRENMEKCGIKKIESPFFTATLLPPKESVVIDDLSLIPPDYKRIKEEADKTLITKAIKDGYEVKGAHLAPGKPGIRIK